MTKYTDCFVDVLTLDDQRRHEADHVLARRHEQQPCFLRSVLDGRRAAIHPHAAHQPTAAQFETPAEPPAKERGPPGEHRARFPGRVTLDPAISDKTPPKAPPRAKWLG